MCRINLLEPENAPEASKTILEEIKSKGRRIINIVKIMANSPAALNTFLGIQKALKHKALSDENAERIAILLSILNGCDYCLAAHSYSGYKIMSEDEVKLAKEGKSNDAKSQAVLDFATLVMKNAGKISDSELTAARAAGLSDEELLDIVTVVSLNFFTNAVNNVAQTPVDFPKPRN